jgi:hypothetical protein
MGKTATSAVAAIEYNKKSLMAMKRHDLDEIAHGLSILNAHTLPNKVAVTNAILEEQNGGEIVGELNERQRLFCELYGTHIEFYGNGTQAYIEAYDVSLGKPGAYQMASAAASRLLMDVKVLEYITSIQEQSALNDVAVDKHMAFWITQRAHPQVAMAAIKEYNKLKKRTVDAAAPVALTQNNYNVSIHDERGKALAQKYTDFMLEATTVPITEETMTGLRDARDYMQSK